MVTYTALASALNANASAVGSAAGGTPIVAGTIQGLAQLLTILASHKGWGTPPLLKSTTAKEQLNPE